MDNERDVLAEMEKKIRVLRQTAQELFDSAVEIEAVRRNAKRILASVKMLELNVCDINETG